MKSSRYRGYHLVEDEEGVRVFFGAEEIDEFLTEREAKDTIDEWLWAP